MTPTVSRVVEHGIDAWSSDEWRARATAWLDERLARTGDRRTGDAEQPHLEPWSTALRAPTTRGVVWLKAPGPGTAFEVGVYELLHRVARDRVLEPIAIDTERSWIALPDGGATVGDRLGGTDLVRAFESVLPQYAQLQRDAAPHADALVARGVADMRAPAMPGRFDEALDAVRARADPETYDRLAGLRPAVASWCDRLTAAPGGASIDHNDLHPHNVFLDAAGRARFFDWGDAVVAHPFASMLVALGWVRDHVEDADEHDVARLRDAYLEIWSDVGPRADLVDTLALATRVGRIARALVWHRAVGWAGDVPETFARAPLAWLTTLLDAP
jgi:hypothetical protein